MTARLLAAVWVHTVRQAISVVVGVVITLCLHDNIASHAAPARLAHTVPPALFQGAATVAIAQAWTAVFNNEIQVMRDAAVFSLPAGVALTLSVLTLAMLLAAGVAVLQVTAWPVPALLTLALPSHTHTVGTAGHRTHLGRAVRASPAGITGTAARVWKVFPMA